MTTSPPPCLPCRSNDGEDGKGALAGKRAWVVLALAVLGILAGGGRRLHSRRRVTARASGRGCRTSREGERTPIAGVEIVVVDSAGDEVGRQETDDTGTALICLDAGPGDYTVTLNEDTLPDDAALAGESEFVLNEGSFLTSIRNLVFFTGESSRQSIPFYERLAQRTVDGIRLGLILAITSVGLSLIFGTTGLTNFAHGELVTFGGMMVYLFSETIGLPLTVGTVIAVALGGLLGYVLNAGLFAPLRRRRMGLVSQMVVTVGLALLLRNVYLFQFGGDFRFLSAYNSQVAWDLGPVAITPRDFTITVVSFAVLVTVALVLQRTRLGKATRAVSDNGGVGLGDRHRHGRDHPLRVDQRCRPRGPRWRLPRPRRGHQPGHGRRPAVPHVRRGHAGRPRIGLRRARSAGSSSACWSRSAPCSACRPS